MGNYNKESDPLYIKPSRDLSVPEAVALLTQLQDIGELTISDLKQGTMTATRQIKLSTKMAGIEYWHASNKNAGRFGSVRATLDSEFTPSLQFAVVLYKFAVYLRDLWGATKIVWGGIGSAGAGKSQDCHENGHCVDFYGADTTSGGVFDVRRDWFYRGVYLKNGKRHPPDPHDNDRWGLDSHTYYRFTVNSDTEKPAGTPDYFNPNAEEFFADVYAFVCDECNVGVYDISADAFKRGEPFKPGYTVHPDYPTFLRRPHNDHMHFQLGIAKK